MATIALSTDIQPLVKDKVAPLATLGQHLMMAERCVVIPEQSGRYVLVTMTTLPPICGIPTVTAATVALSTDIQPLVKEV